MNIENFITNKKSIEKLTYKMTLIESDGWETKYVNNTDKTEWIKVYLESEYHGGGNPILYKLPKPTQSELIKKVTEITDLKQISAIACLLKYSEYDEEDNHLEYRGELIEKLESIINEKDFKVSSFDQKRLTTIIYDSELNQPFNQRKTLKKSPSNVNKDYLFYKDISERAKQIITIANNGYNSLWRIFLRKITTFK